MEKGLVHLTYGDGRGKTTAAIGLALRALGNGWRVCIVQFLKGNPSGEITALSGMPGISVLRAGSTMKFTNRMSDEELLEAEKECGRLLSQAQERASKGEFDMLVLDEVLDACLCGLLDEETLISFIEHKPAHLEIVMTGHRRNDALAGLSDYVTETTAIKHPYNRGVHARRGIEY